MPLPVGIPAGCLSIWSSNRRNLKSPFLTTRCLYQWDRSANMSSNSRNLKLPSLTTRCLYWGDRSASWSANMSSNSRNLKSPFLTTRYLYQRGWSASWSANMSSNSRNLKLQSLTTRCLYWGVDLPVDLPIWALTVEISRHHSWPLDASTSEGWSASWSANMSSNSRNLKSPFLTTRCLYQRG